VDLGEGVAVSRVVIYNRNDGDASHASHVSGRLSNSVVSLINYQNNTLKTYSIGDATNVPEFEFVVSMCLDTPGWVDKERDGCDWYEQYDLPGCPRHGNFGGNMGSASENCCYCLKIIATDFSTEPTNAILSGSAIVSNRECVLTPNSASKNGYLLFDSIASTPNMFNAQWDYRVFDGNGADGTSFNYGPMTNSSGDEKGMADAVLVVSFIEYQGERVELKYDGSLIQTSPFNLTGNAYRQVAVNLSPSSIVTVSVGGRNVLSSSLANTDYSLRDKTGWRFGFAGRTGAATNKHSIKNLDIIALRPYCFRDSADGGFRSGELYKAVDAYISQNCATNLNCHARQQYGDISTWCTKDLTNMHALFYNVTNFNEPLNGWNVNKVTNMSCMFYGATKFNQQLNGWNTGSVTIMNNMFDGALKFNQSLNGWDVSRVLDMSWMFADSEFIGGDPGGTIFNQPLSNWNLSSVTNLQFMFAGAQFFNQPLNAWNVSGVTNMAGMFARAPKFNQNLAGWKVGKVTNMNFIFQGATVFNQALNTWDVSAVTSMVAMFNNAENFNQTVSSWNVGKVTSMESMFDGASHFNWALNS
jgi:surface protein